MFPVLRYLKLVIMFQTFSYISHFLINRHLFTYKSSNNTLKEPSTTGVFLVVLKFYYHKRGTVVACIILGNLSKHWSDE